jgi:hypothetical protein
MHDARPERAADSGQTRSAEAIEKRGDHGAGGDAGTGMDDHARGFVHDGEVGVFIQDIEGDGFGFDAGGLLLRDFKRHDFAGLDVMGRFAGSAVDFDVALVHQQLDARTAECRKLRDEKNIEALTGFFGSDDEFHAWASVN